MTVQKKPKNNGGEPVDEPSAEEEKKLKHLRTTMENVFSNPELTRKMIQTHPETIVSIFRSVYLQERLEFVDTISLNQRSLLTDTIVG